MPSTTRALPPAKPQRELDDVLRDAKSSLERLAGAEKEAQDLRVQLGLRQREVSGLTKEFESRKEMEREHDAKYAESLHAATLLSGGSCRTLLFRAISRERACADLKKSREDNVKALNLHVAIEAAAQERMEELKREHARAIDSCAAQTTAARAEHESSRKAAEAEHQASLAELRTQHGRLVAAHRCARPRWWLRALPSKCGSLQARTRREGPRDAGGHQFASPRCGAAHAKGPASVRQRPRRVTPRTSDGSCGSRCRSRLTTKRGTASCFEPTSSK